MTVAQLVSVEVIGSETPPSAEFDYGLISDPDDREWAESAAGFITFGLGQAVVKVLEAGNLLMEAKRRLPHGEYLPWVERACGLKPQYAQKLVKAAEWANAAHERHLEGITDATTLFLLSADATKEEVREWFMERCAAGNPPTRKEVQERKRAAQQPRQPQPTETLALSILRKGDLNRMREALDLADRAEVVTPAQVMAEQRLRELGKQRFIAGLDADFHRMKDGQWIRLPHAPAAATPPKPEPEPQAELFTAESVTQTVHGELVSIKRAAEMLDLSQQYLTNQLTPTAIQKRGGPLTRNGYIVSRSQRGFVLLTPTPPHQ
jgi:hypothetical protein